MSTDVMARQPGQIGQPVVPTASLEPASDEDALIARWIIPDPHKGGRPEARVRDYFMHVWALAGYFRDNAIPGGVTDSGVTAAAAYQLPLEAVQAALAFYRRNRSGINARMDQNETVPGEW